MRVCSTPGCPTISDKPKCPGHRRQAELARGTTEQRGYGNAHQLERKRWAPLVATGRVNCWRCGNPITSTEPWDLGHDDADRTKYRGPEHANRCNRSAAGRSAHHRDVGGT